MRSLSLVLGLSLLVACNAQSGVSYSDGDGGVGGDSCLTALDVTGCPCDVPGTTRACYTGPKSVENVGACKDGQQKCTTLGEFSTWSACTGSVLPTTEDCTGTGMDTNCNGKVGCDELACAGKLGCCMPGYDRACYSGPPGTENVGVCHDGINICDVTGAWEAACTGEQLPSSEAGHCQDGLDNDCNGLIDCEDPACITDPACIPQSCMPGTQQACYTGPSGTAGIGVCTSGIQTCDATGSGWGGCMGETTPSAESGHCKDGLDDDCNGLTDCADPACASDPACCTPTPGVDSTIYATSADTLYTIDPSTWNKFAVGNYNAPGGDRMTDLAMTPNGNVYTLSGTALYTINTSTGQATKLVSLGGTLNNALTFLPDNTLLAADAGGTLKHVDPSNGAITVIGTYCGASACGANNGFGSSGDLVAVSTSTLYGVSATDRFGNDASANNLLIVVDKNTGLATEVGPIGFANVFGLAYYGGMVLGFDYLGDIINIDPATGHGVKLSQQVGTNFFGGTTSPLTPPTGCL